MSKRIYTYEQAISRLENILQEIERNNEDIDKLYLYLKEADELMKVCRTRLYEVDEKIKSVLDSMNGEKSDAF